MPSFIERFRCNDIGNVSTFGDVSANTTGSPVGPAQVFATDTGYEVAKLDIESGKYYTIFDIPSNRTTPPFTYLNACGINPLDNLLYCVAIVDASNYLVRVDAVRVEFVAKLPGSWNNASVKFNSGAFGRNGVFYFTTFAALIYQANHTSTMVGVSHQDDPELEDLTDLGAFKVNRTGGFADMVMVYDDLIGTGVPEEFGIVINSWNLIIMKLSTPKIEYWLAPVTGLKGLTTNFGAGWSFGGHVFFSSNHGLGVFEIPLEEVFLYDCRDHWCPQVTLKMVGKSAPTNRNDGIYCYGGSNPWVTTIKPFDCATVAGIMKTFHSNNGYDIMGLNITSGNQSLVINIPYNRTDPPYSNLTSVSVNPKDDIFYGVMLIGSQPYMVRLDREAVEFIAKLKQTSGGYVGGVFSNAGHFFYTSLSEPPIRFDVRNVASLRGYISQDDEGLKDLSKATGMKLEDSKNATPSGMSGLVTVSGNFEGEGDSGEYVIGIDANGNVVVTKDNCSHFETWFVPTSTTFGNSKSFGPAYTFDNKVFFEARDGSGIFELPLDGFNVGTSSKIQLKLAGISQKQGGSDFAGWSEDGFNCMKSPSPFSVGDCQLGYHEVAAEADECPAGSVLMLSHSNAVSHAHNVGDCPEWMD